MMSELKWHKPIEMKPTMNLRTIVTNHMCTDTCGNKRVDFFSMRLQQQWEHPLTGATEWRDVPVVEEEES